uniref:Uncharacterized protein n=1 Tax=Opuntia streptacantha TaxID=393608 RepID=A0A7C9DLU4_OPUST
MHLTFTYPAGSIALPSVASESSGSVAWYSTASGFTNEAASQANCVTISTQLSFLSSQLSIPIFLSSWRTKFLNFPFITCSIAFCLSSSKRWLLETSISELINELGFVNSIPSQVTHASLSSSKLATVILFS